MIYVFIWGVYIASWFLLTIAHCKINAHPPVTTAPATEAPVATPVPPPGLIIVAFIPPAAISGFILLSLVYPLPDSLTTELLFWL